MEKEVRVFQLDKLKVEKREDGKGPRITGYAAVFNKLSEDLGGFREKINPGAFKDAIGKSDVRGLFNHDSNFVLGRQSAGTLRIKEDKVGLHMEIDPPDTQIIRDLVLAPIERGDVREQSFGFIVEEDSWKNLDGNDKDKPITRTIMKVRELFDVSPVTFPAYPDTSVALRSMEKAKEPRFKPASISDILKDAIIQYCEAECQEDRAEASHLIVDTLWDELSDESRKQFTTSSGTPDGDPPDSPADIPDADVDQDTLDKTKARWQELDKRIAKILT